MPPRARSRGSTVLRWIITALVLVVVSGAAAVVVFAIARSAVDAADVPSALPLLAAATVGIATACASVRWIRSAVIALIDGVDDQQISAIAVLDHELDAELGPDQYLTVLAQTTASLLRVPWVEFDIDPVAMADHLPSVEYLEGSPWSGHLAVAHGSPGVARPSTVRPVALRGVAIGAVTVGSRSGGRELSHDDVAALDAIARQAATTVSNARSAEALNRSRERAVSAIEEERRRLRRDLHDELGPNLATMKLHLGVLRRTGDLTPRAANTVDELTAVVDATTADVRRIVEDLRPPLLDDLGLAEALRCLRFVPNDLHLIVDPVEGLDDLPAATQVALFRIGSEAIRNVVRHAGATTCAVRFQRTDAAVTLTVLDDGAGFASGPTGGVGIAAMRERADELGGLVTVSPGTGRRGCCVAATIPVRAGAVPFGPEPEGESPT